MYELVGVGIGLLIWFCSPLIEDKQKSRDSAYRQNPTFYIQFTLKPLRRNRNPLCNRCRATR